MQYENKNKKHGGPSSFCPFHAPDQALVESFFTKNDRVLSFNIKT